MIKNLIRMKVKWWHALLFFLLVSSAIMLLEILLIK